MKKRRPFRGGVLYDTEKTYGLVDGLAGKGDDSLCGNLLAVSVSELGIDRENELAIDELYRYFRSFSERGVTVIPSTLATYVSPFLNLTLM